MKKNSYNIGIMMLCLLFVFSACTDSVVSNEIIKQGDKGGGDKEVPVVLDLRGIFEPKGQTYGTVYPGIDVPGTSVEDAIDNVVLYIFNDLYECEKILSESYPVPSPVGPVMVKTGLKHFVAIVNAVGKLPALETTNPANVNYATLMQEITDAAAPNSSTFPESPFLMTGTRSFTVSGDHSMASALALPIPIDVIRACAKVTMTVTSSGKAASNEIKLKRISLLNGADRVSLFDTYSSNAILYNQDNIISLIPNQHIIKQPTNPSVVMKDTFYVHESLCGSDKGKAVRFEILAEVNSPSNERTFKFFLATYAPASDSTFNIKRNHWYDINVNIIDAGSDSVYVTVNACPWNVADTIPVTPGEGAEFKTAVPFKLVKNYTATELSGSNASFAAIDEHTKGASWVKVKATSGTSWSIEPKNSEPRNQGVIASLGGTSWAPLPISGTGNDNEQTVYIYRPYREDNEPELGPALVAKVGGNFKQDLIIQPRDTTPIPTNSYILRPQGGAKANETRAYIPLAGVYRYWEDYLLANGDSIPLGDIFATLSWQDRTGNVIKPGTLTVLNNDKRDSAYIYVEAGNVQGNAIIDMRVGGSSATDPIYWSFHIWVTDYNPYEAAGQKLYNATKTVFMDRNLGALSNVHTNDGEARGLYYQFGRKDPFPRGNNWTDAFAAGLTVSPGTLSPVLTLRPLAAIPASIKNPRTFYTTPTWPLAVENSNLWSTAGGHKTAFDPCPEGWRIPKQENPSSSPWQGLTNSLLAYNSAEIGRYHSGAGYYPLSGYISSSSITGTGTTAYYWSSGPITATTATGLYITNGTAVSTSPSGMNMAYGASVRCIVDRDYLFKNNGGLFGSGSITLIDKTN